MDSVYLASFTRSMLRVLFPDLLHSSRKGRDRGMVKRMFSFWALHRVTVWHGLAANMMLGAAPLLFAEVLEQLSL